MRKIKMQKIKSKNMAILIAVFLTSSMICSMTLMPGTDAALKLLTKQPYAYVGAMPNPVGVGQETLIHLGITDELQNTIDGWKGLTVTVTKPDGTTQTLGPFRTDSTGGTGTLYVPDTAGTYYLQTHFPEQRYNWTSSGGASVLYKSADSEKTALIVQETEVPIYPTLPLPTEYWTRPINAQLREWKEVTSDFLDPTRYAGPLIAGPGPDSAHILWTKDLATGGLVGGTLGDFGYDIGDAYEGKFQGSVVIAGVLYYNQFEPRGGTNIEQNVVAVDLHTGEELWVRNWNNTRLSFGQVFYWDSYNLHGAYAILWATSGSTWNAYEAATGRWMYGITNVPSGTMIRGEKGELYVLQVNQANGWMALWNSSAIVVMDGSWNPHGTTYNATATNPASALSAAQRSWAWNVTIPKGLPGTVQKVLADRIIGSNVVARTAENLITERINKPIALWSISLKPGQIGTLLYNTSWTPPQTDLFISWGDAGLKEGIFALWAKETRQSFGFNIDTGAYLWDTESQPYLDTFGIRVNVRLGMLFTTGFAGEVFAWDVNDGSLIWRYNVTDPYNQIKEGLSNYPVLFDFYTQDGRLYLVQMEHSPTTPLARNAPYICLNATTGEVIWKIDGLKGVRWGGPNVVADGIIGFFNAYDNRIYAIGKGPSATTVTAPDINVPLGSPLTIRGMVTDVSPGTEEYELTARFPSGVPAVSDASISDWMKYVYMQLPIPSNSTGVSVSIDVLDANGNYRNIGSATSDTSGAFSFQWTPDIPGKYTLYATFAGSNSYWPSYSETSFSVDQAVPTATPSPLVEQSVSDQYFVPAVIGIIVAIAICFAITILVLRKRP
jgi:hypothetical protein